MARKAPATIRSSTIRCAIYTRKSTEEGLEQAFNSLDAQREACSAYILSQRHEGWAEVRHAYDDGGYSGGSMERPGLKRLLADIEAGKVDVIVVYKVDRLTRALSDFAKIVDVLDRRGASFVSVTQAFNTTTSMGRLTLNVLLSFAQFEREVTGERIRDKVAASKAKGMWMGGPIPLGYRLEERKLLIAEHDADTVRHIFRRYIALGSGRELIADLRSNGYRTKVRQLASGATRGGIPFGRGMLFALLSNRIYRGEIVHKGTAYPGEHDAIVDQRLWDQVQAVLEENRVSRKERRGARHPSLLVSILFDEHGRRMSPSHANKSGKRYRYYVTPASELQSDEARSSIPAHDIETAVVERVRALLTDRHALASLISEGDVAAALQRGLAGAAKLNSPVSRRSIIGMLVERVEMDDRGILIKIDRTALCRLMQVETAEQEALVVSIPAMRLRHGKETKLVLLSNDAEAAETDATLISLLGEAHSARDAMLGSPGQTVKQVAADIGQCRSRLAKLVGLSWLAPDIVDAILNGRHPPRLTPRRLLDTKLPLDWTAQRAALGMA